jgi:hypothetical protein
MEDIQPSDQPVGSSPRNNDVFFLPGGVFTRPALKGLFASTGAGKIISTGDFRLASGEWNILRLDDQGNLYAAEAITGSRTFLFQTAGLCRQHYAPYGTFLFVASSGVGTSPNPWATKQSGFDVPAYWNGSSVSRVTSDAPPPPSVEVITVPPASLSGSTAVRSGNYVKAYVGTSLPDNFTRGFWVSLTDLGNNVVNGTALSIVSMTRSTTGIVTVTLASPWTNLPPGAAVYLSPGGAAGIASVTSGSPTVTYSSGIPFTSAWNNHYVILGGVPYLINTVSGTTITLYENYGGATSLVTFEIPPSGHAGVTNGSMTVNFLSGTNFNQSWAGQIISINGAPYVIAVVGSSTQLQLTTAYAGTTDPNSPFYIESPFGNSSFQTVYEVVSTTQFTYQSLNTDPITMLGGTVWMQWTPLGGTYGNAAQITEAGTDGGGAYIKWFQLGPDETLSFTTAPILTIIGQSSPGTHQFVVFYENADGQQTAPSTIISAEAQGNGQLYQFSNLPIGPSGTTARIIAGTASGGDSFFYLSPVTTASQDGNGPSIVTGTEIQDNTTTSVTIDFSDATLLSGQAIDIVGNNLFAQVRLDPCCGVFTYSSRLFWWGEINNRKNMQNLGFDAAAGTTPAYWDASAGDGTGTLVAGDRFGGFFYRMPTGGNALIQQSVYQDQFGGTILEPGTAYYVRILARVGVATSGTLNFRMHSPSGAASDVTGILDVATFTTDWAWCVTSFTTPDIIPSDYVLQVFLSGTTGGTWVDIDELEIIPESQPVLDTQVRVSYSENPFGYDGVTGIIAPLGMRAPLAGLGQLREYLYLIDELDLRETQNTNSGEPASWTIKLIDQNCGCSSPWAVTASEDWLEWAGRHGVRFFDGNPETRKINQEIARTWETVQWADPMSMWAAADPVQRQTYFGIKTSSADNTADVLLVLNYRLADSTYNVPDPVHISTYSGKMLATDLGRKWTKWYRSLPCGASISSNPYGLGVAKNFLFGGSTQQRIYYLDALNYPPLNGDQTLSWNPVDDDFGGYSSEYLTSPFYPRELEANPAISSYRKLYTAISFHATGFTGEFFTNVTAYMDALDCPSIPFPVFQLDYPDQGYDLSLGINVVCERMFLGFSSPSGSAFGLTELAVSGRMDMVFPMRGSL